MATATAVKATPDTLAPVAPDTLAPAPAPVAPVAPAPAPAHVANVAPVANEVDAVALVQAQPQRIPYTLAPDSGVAYGAGILARGVHNSWKDANDKPLPVLVYEPRGARAQVFPLGAACYAIASGLIDPATVAALQKLGG